jgi:hypothetical protein
MLLLFETPAGYSLFKVKDEDKLKDIDVRSFYLSLFVTVRVVGLFFLLLSREREKGIARFISLVPPPILSEEKRGQLTRKFSRRARALKETLSFL